jgi:glycine cleavage system regulatory protein
MATSLVFAVIGLDRPGLVERLSTIVVDHQGSWLDSRMSVLSNEFAGVVLVSVPDEQVESLRTALLDLEGEGLRVMVEDASGEEHPRLYRRTFLELVGQDRPGIVREVSRVLHARHVNIDDLVTEKESGAMSGEPMFKLIAELHVPHDVSIELLREHLEKLANEIMVDMELDEETEDPRRR